MQDLKRKGWHLEEDKIKTMVGENNMNDEYKLEKLILNQDIHEVGQQYIEQYLKENNGNMNCVLQISKLKNIAASSKKQDAYSGTRMLKMTLTDGFYSCNGLEINNLKDVNLNTAPGTKVQLVGNVQVINGYLLLTPLNCKVLGGRVDKLFNKWKLAKELSNHSRNDIKGGDDPPPFIPFGQTLKKSVEIKPKVMPSTSTVTNSENPEDVEFNKQRNAAIKDVHKEQNMREFSHKAKPMVTNNKDNQKPYNKHKEADGNTSVTVSNKVVKNDGVYRDLYRDDFVVDQTFLNEFMQMGFKKWDCINALKTSKNGFDAALDLLTSSGDNQQTNKPVRNEQNSGRQSNYKSRRGGGRQSEEDHLEASKPATLFNFLESKIPITEKPRETKSYNQDNQRAGSSHNSGYDQRDHYSRYNRQPQGQVGNGYKESFHQGRNNSNAAKHKNPRNEQKNRYEKQQYMKSEKGFQQSHGRQNYNNKNNSKPAAAYQSHPRPQNNNQSGDYNERKNANNPRSYNQQKSGGNKNNKYNSVGNKYEPSNKAPVPTSTIKSDFSAKEKVTGAGGMSHGPTTFKSVQSESITKPQINQISRSNLYVGMECLAKYWEDRMIYPAIITDIHPTAETAVVLFTAYGNYEEVSFRDIQIHTNVVNNYPQRPASNRQMRPAKAYYMPPSQRNTIQKNPQ